MSEAFSITPIPLLVDNFAYVIANKSTREAVVVDPSDAAPVIEHLTREKLTLTAIACTHHHFDHVGGVEALVARDPDITVYGSIYDHEKERIPRQTQALFDGEEIELAGFDAHVMAVPGHTLGAIAYVLGDAVFTGDTLFVGGCGRVFEGTMPMMLASLDKLAALSPHTRVFCGHEYAESNLLFGESIEPNTLAIMERIEEVRRVRATGEAYIGRTMAEELATNVFLRTEYADVIEAARALGAQSDSREHVFETLRRKKGHG